MKLLPREARVYHSYFRYVSEHVSNLECSAETGQRPTTSRVILLVFNRFIINTPWQMYSEQMSDKCEMPYETRNYCVNQHARSWLIIIYRSTCTWASGVMKSNGRRKQTTAKGRLMSDFRYCTYIWPIISCDSVCLSKLWIKYNEIQKCTKKTIKRQRCFWNSPVVVSGIPLRQNFKIHVGCSLKRLIFFKPKFEVRPEKLLLQTMHFTYFKLRYGTYVCAMCMHDEKIRICGICTCIFVLRRDNRNND